MAPAGAGPSLREAASGPAGLEPKLIFIDEGSFAMWPMQKAWLNASRAYEWESTPGRLWTPPERTPWYAEYDAA